MTFKHVARESKNGDLIIQVQYVHKEKRMQVTTGVRVSKQNWNSKTGRPFKMNEMDRKLIDAKLNELKKHVYNLQDNKQSISVSNVSRTYKEAMKIQNNDDADGRTLEPIESVYDALQSFIEAHKNEREENTLKNYNLVLKDVKGYQESKKRILTFSQLNQSFPEKFKKYLRTNPDNRKQERVLKDSTIGVRFKILKTFLHWCEGVPNIKVDPAFKNYHVAQAKKTKVHLTESELELFRNCPVNTKNQEIYKDLFLLQANTGLAISDLKRLSRDHIVGNNIILYRKKTEKRIFCPINKESLAILEKYDYQLPSFVEQSFNRILKDLVKQSGIDSKIETTTEIKSKRIKEIKYKYELLSSHSATKTFITRAAERGFTISQISAITSKTPNVILRDYLSQDDKEIESKMGEW